MPPLFTRNSINNANRQYKVLAHQKKTSFRPNVRTLLNRVKTVQEINNEKLFFVYMYDRFEFSFDFYYRVLGI